jgi:hypothetical protein
MNTIGQFTGAWAAGGVLGWMELAAVLVLLGCGAVALGYAIAPAAVRRDGRQVPGLPGDGEPLSRPERVLLAQIERHYAGDDRKRAVTRKRRPAARTRNRAVRQ